MFNYSQRTKAYLLGILIVLVAFVIFLIAVDNSKSRDLAMVGQVKVLAEALERYYDKYREYPRAQSTNLPNIRYISENGINAPGDENYYNGEATWQREGVYSSNGTGYVIDYRMENRWDLWGLSFGGGNCRMIERTQVTCVSE